MSHRKRAIEWLKKNPGVVPLFEQFGQEMVNAGRRFGAMLLAQRVRWETKYQYDSDDYKLNNNYVPYVARYLLWRNPAWAGYMEFRSVPGELNGPEVITDLDLI